MIRWGNDYIDLNIWVDGVSGQNVLLAELRPVDRDDACRDGYAKGKAMEWGGKTKCGVLGPFVARGSRPERTS